MFGVDHIHLFRSDLGHNTGTGNGFSTTNRNTILSLGLGTDKSWAPHPTARIEDLSMNGNFTIGFWFRSTNTNTNNIFLRFEKTDLSASELTNGSTMRQEYLEIQTFENGKTISSKLSLNDATIWPGDENSKFFTESTSIDFGADWNHFTFVKNGELIGLWINKLFKGYISLTQQQQIDFGRMNMVLVGNGASYAPDATNNNRFADLRVLGYANSNVPANGLITSDYAFIDKLQSR